MANVVMVDVSAYQGKINFNILKTKAQAIYVRIGAGNTWLDPTAGETIASAKRAGIVWGGYWVPYIGKDWKQHISSFSKALIGYGGGDLPPVWDCEVTQYERKFDTTNWLSKLIPNSITALPKKPMIYTRATWWNANTYRQDWPREYDLWVAHYTKAPEGTIVNGKPVPWIPDDWSDIAVPRTWTFWQYSADGNGLGAEYGVQSESIDINRFNPDRIEDFNAKFGTDIKPLVETPHPPPTKPTFVRVKSTPTNIRNAPNLTPASDVGDLIQGAVLEVLAEQGDFYQVKTYVHKSVVTVVS